METKAGKTTSQNHKDVCLSKTDNLADEHKLGRKKVKRWLSEVWNGSYARNDSDTPDFETPNSPYKMSPRNKVKQVTAQPPSNCISSPRSSVCMRLPRKHFAIKGYQDSTSGSIQHVQSLSAVQKKHTALLSDTDAESLTLSEPVKPNKKPKKQSLDSSCDSDAQDFPVKRSKTVISKKQPQIVENETSQNNSTQSYSDGVQRKMKAKIQKKSTTMHKSREELLSLKPVSHTAQKLDQSQSEFNSDSDIIIRSRTNHSLSKYKGFVKTD